MNTHARVHKRNATASATKAPPWAGSLQPELSDRIFSSFCQLIHHHAGIHLSPHKKELLRARLTKILRSRGFNNFQEYYRQVIGDQSGQELTQLLDAISTNQTAFWREPAHFIYLSQEILPLWHRQQRGGLQWRFWSAGCSSGEEPYTMAMVLSDSLPPHDLQGIKVYASDLNTQVLDQARRGIYPQSRVMPLPEGWKRRFFQKGMRQWEGYVRVKPEVRALVEFFHFNLMDSFAFPERFDLIFCRNVMIYFERSTQGELVDKFYDCLRPGGFLILGHSESLSNLRHRFTYMKPTIYRK